MSKYLKHVLLGASIFVPLFSSSAQDAAPAADEGQRLDDIVVTARKKAESLQDVPVSVVAISQTQLQNNLATDISKIAELAPQVVVGRGINGTGAIITIRGISTSSSDSGLDQSVVVNMDGVPLSRGRVISTTLFDIQQVEVLQGPQSLFFGKNSPAGVISISSVNPTSEIGGYVKAGYEFVADERFVEGAITLPITDNFQARIAVRASEMEGWIKNVAGEVVSPIHPAVTLPGAWDGGRTPGGRDIAGRVTLLWTPTSDFTANLKVFAGRQDMNSVGGFTEVFCINGLTTPLDTGFPMTGADCEKNRRKSESAYPVDYTQNFPYANGGEPYLDTEYVLSSLNLTKQLGDVEVVSTTGYYNQGMWSAHNATFSPFTEVYNTETERYKLFTQELRLASDFSGPLNFMVGGYYDHSTRSWFTAAALNYIYNAAAQNYTTAQQTTDTSATTFSFFGQLNWQILPTLELSGGVRYTHDEKTVDLVNTVVNLAAPLGPALRPVGSVLHVPLKSDNASPEVTLTWHPADDQLLYVAYKTGYKSGGASNGVFLTRGATVRSYSFGPETVEGFEGGYKATLMNGTLRLDLVGYRYNYDGLQVSFFDPVSLAFRIGNAANARTEGITGSFAFLAADNLTLNGNIGYNRARYLSFTNAQCYSGQTAATGCVGGVQDLSGKDLTRAPRLTFMLGGTYDTDISSNFKLSLSSSAFYTSSYQAQTDYGPGGLQSSFWRLNAGVTLGTADDKYQISLLGRNLTNSYYMVNSNNQPAVGFAPNQYIGTFNRPREVVLQAAYNF